MNNQSIFETASRTKLRFTSQSGLLTVEQLWDLPLDSVSGVSLRKIAEVAFSALEAVKTRATKFDFFSPKKEAIDPLLELRCLIIEHIVTVKVNENEAKVRAKAVATEKAELKELIEQKKREAKGSQSLASLEAQLAKLG